MLLSGNVWILRVHKGVPVTKCHQTLFARILHASALPKPNGNLLILERRRAHEY